MTQVKTAEGIEYRSFGEAMDGLVDGSVKAVVQGDEATKTGEPTDKAETAPAADGAPDYEKMTRADLEALAAARTIDVTGAGNKAEIIALLKG